ncbi:MAG: RsmB/NOP family class I SAM-dependent RNA methyltransferase [Pseudomonadota bacterium]
MSKTADPARRAAWAALLTSLRDKQMLTIADGLSAPEQARAARLARLALRHMGRIDRVLGHFVSRKPSIEVHLMLRLGAAELLADRAAAHGVVDAYVTLGKSMRSTTRAAGMLNAVLRKVATKGPELWNELPVQRLPPWLRKPLVKTYGGAAVTNIETAHQDGAPIDLTLRDDTGIPGGNRLPTGSVRMQIGTQVSALPGYDAGHFWVQDAAAALPARCLGDVRDATVLDLCTAPGGKALQLAAAGAHVIALDRSKERLRRLRENLSRTGLRAQVVTADARRWRGGPFDAILLDAPCSATGTIRRHPELPFIRDANDIKDLVSLQSELIDAAVAQLRPGGRLVYCTCSLLPEEGEAQIEAALSRHPRLKPVPVDPRTLGGTPDWVGAHGALRLRPDFWPDLGGMDGFYIIALEGR